MGYTNPMKNNTFIIGGIIALAVIAGALVFFGGGGTSVNGVPYGKYDEFAQCLKDNGVTFFGAFWCPHCQRTKAMFGSSVDKLPYVECSTPDGNSQTQVCKDNGITAYPTWQFKDGTRITGEHTLQELAEKSGCMLPAGDATTTTDTASTTGAATNVQ